MPVYGWNGRQLYGHRSKGLLYSLLGTRAYKDATYTDGYVPRFSVKNDTCADFGPALNPAPVYAFRRAERPSHRDG